MKRLITDKKLLVTLIVDLVITVGSPFLVHLICYLNGVNFEYTFLFAIYIFINGLLAYLIGDLILVSYKRRNKIVTSGIPDDVISRSRGWRIPFVISLIVDLLIFGAFAIVFYTTGHWPLM